MHVMQVKTMDYSYSQKDVHSLRENKQVVLR